MFNFSDGKRCSNRLRTTEFTRFALIYVVLRRGKVRRNYVGRSDTTGEGVARRRRRSIVEREEKQRRASVR
jgi:hypothetical protein